MIVIRESRVMYVQRVTTWQYNKTGRVGPIRRKVCDSVRKGGNGSTETEGGTGGRLERVSSSRPWRWRARGREETPLG